jgi:4-nitrophenyl phosphatase
MVNNSLYDRLGQIQCFLLDMDGTFYLGDHLLPGAGELLDLFEIKKIDYLFLTNNSSRHQRQYSEKIARFGINVSPNHIFTSGEATALYLKKKYSRAKLYVVGTDALEHEFETHGFVLTDHSPEIVVLGFDTTLTYTKLWKLCDFVRAGLPYIATHPDINCPTETGFMPDIGAMIAFVATATGRTPDVIIGKPNPPIVDAIVEKTGISVSHLCMVGDRLYTDIAMGKTGITTVLVLSGETGINDLKETSFRPDFIMQDLAELVSILRMV